MKVSRSWLEVYSQGLPETEAIVAAFERIGLEVEKVTKAQTQALVARVLTVTKHPDATRLQCCSVDVGGEKPFDVVCGAPNVHASMLTAFLPVGAHLPDGSKITKRKIRGVTSEGMLCSGPDVGLIHSADGLLVLKEGSIGQQLAEIPNLYDPVITLETTPNRPDWLGVYGLARDLYAADIGTLTSLKRPYFAINTSILAPKVFLEHEACPLFICRSIRGIDPKAKTPEWMRQQLTNIGIGCVHPVVDITNYVAHALCRPLHAYDAESIENAEFHVRGARKGELFQDLNSCEHTLLTHMHVIADNKGKALALGGIIGGASSACRESTTSVILESAWFTPTSVARTARDLGIDTESRRRFERGVDPQSTEIGCDLATKMILKYCGGEAGALAKVGHMPRELSPVLFDDALVKTMTGVSVPPDDIARTLQKLGFKRQEPPNNDKNKGVFYKIPSWRPDIQGPADLVEEVIRIKGVDACVPVPLPLSKRKQQDDAFLSGRLFSRRACRILAGRGFCEVRNWSLIQAKDQSYARTPTEVLSLANPMDEGMSVMRYSLFPGLFRGLEMNRKQGGEEPLRFFEIGNCFHRASRGGEPLVVQKASLSALMHIPRERHKDADDLVVLCDVKEELFHLLVNLGYEREALVVEECLFNPYLHKVEKGREKWCNAYHVCDKKRKKPLGHYGKINPRTLYQYAITYFKEEDVQDLKDMRVVGFELTDFPI